jgi:hypothetical protein
LLKENFPDEELCTNPSLLAVLVISTHAAFALSVPEIDPAMGAGALALIGGVIMVIRGRARK